MWDWATDTGRLDMSITQTQNLWILGMAEILREIEWRAHDYHMAVRWISGHTMQATIKYIIERIKQQAEQHI